MDTRISQQHRDAMQTLNWAFASMAESFKLLAGDWLAGDDEDEDDNVERLASAWRKRDALTPVTWQNTISAARRSLHNARGAVETLREDNAPDELVLMMQEHVGLIELALADVEALPPLDM